MVLAVRSSHCLEVPLSDRRGNLLATKEHFCLVVSLANDKLVKNSELNRRFSKNFSHSLGIKLHQDGKGEEAEAQEDLRVEDEGRQEVAQACREEQP